MKDKIILIDQVWIQA